MGTSDAGLAPRPPQTMARLGASTAAFRAGRNGGPGWAAVPPEFLSGRVLWGTRIPSGSEESPQSCRKGELLAAFMILTRGAGTRRPVFISVCIFVLKLGGKPCSLCWFLASELGSSFPRAPVGGLGPL